MVSTLKSRLSRSLLGLTGKSLPTVADKHMDAFPVHFTSPPTKPGCVIALEAWLDAGNQLLGARWDFANNYDGRPTWPNFKNEWREAVAAEQKAYDKLNLCIEGMSFFSKTPRVTLLRIIDTRRALDADEQTLFNDKWNQLRGSLATSLVLATEAAHKDVRPWGDSGHSPVHRRGASGHLACHDCKYTLYIGKVMHGPDDRPDGFGHGNFAPQDLSKLIEAFIAIHLPHRIEIIPEQDFDLRDWTGYDALRPMPTVTTAIAKARLITVGPIKLRIEPFEDPLT
ncbi:hypothetical protein Poly24_45910 [Rosistilla carotiformis]|uniref:Uncharacterized protein n=2 Tax=Rosistilla carotiformis TaxID=2528017 RepID=A0A518JZ89_9BACT|nr:hypothetical protein Poly24_45910 [Rosistilla carotiformis]